MRFILLTFHNLVVYSLGSDKLAILTLPYLRHPLLSAVMAATIGFLHRNKVEQTASFSLIISSFSYRNLWSMSGTEFISRVKLCLASRLVHDVKVTKALQPEISCYLHPAPC